MGLYNILTGAQVRCSRCGSLTSVDVDLYFGLRNLIEYAVGDCIEWVPEASVTNGGMPPGGDLDGEGYAECASCRRDFFVVVHVRSGRVAGVETDLTRPGHIPDEA